MADTEGTPKSMMDLSQFEGTVIFQGIPERDPSTIFGPLDIVNARPSEAMPVEAAESNETLLPVAVIDEESAPNPGDIARVVARFATVEEAEEFIGTLPNVEKVERGGYGIDAPEPIINSTVHDIGGWGDFDTLRESLLPRIFGVMVQLAEGVVEEFHGDLFHDAEWLRKNLTGPTEFEYMVRTSGTNLGESARIMANIGAPGAIRYRLTVAHNERMSWSLTVEEL